jgi:hypothetical protein
MRKYLMHTSIKLDRETFTPSDFCLMGIDMEFDNYTQDEIEKEIKDAFLEDY